MYRDRERFDALANLHFSRLIAVNACFTLEQRFTDKAIIESLTSAERQADIASDALATDFADGLFLLLPRACICTIHTLAHIYEKFYIVQDSF